MAHLYEFLLQMVVYFPNTGNKRNKKQPSEFPRKKKRACLRKHWQCLEDQHTYKYLYIGPITVNITELSPLTVPRS